MEQFTEKGSGTTSTGIKTEENVKGMRKKDGSLELKTDFSFS